MGVFSRVCNPPESIGDKRSSKLQCEHGPFLAKFWVHKCQFVQLSARVHGHEHGNSKVKDWKRGEQFFSVRCLRPPFTVILQGRPGGLIPGCIWSNFQRNFFRRHQHPVHPIYPQCEHDFRVGDWYSPSPTNSQVQTLTLTTAASLPGGTAGTAYTTTLQASGGTTPYSWSMSSGALPAGLTLAARTGVISGTPTTAGTFSFTAKVTDSTAPTAQTATQSFSITVAAAVTPVQITTSSIPSAQVGTAYTTTLAASGGTTPYGWSISSGGLPAGLTLAAASGTISGTPTTAGTFSFTLKVTDSTAPTPRTAAKSFSITVAAAVTQVQITTSSVPSGQVGTAYTTTLAASGGTTPYSWSVKCRSVASRLMLAPASGAISGTPYNSGDIQLHGQGNGSTAADTANGSKVVQHLQLRQRSAQVQITTSSIPSAQVGTAYTTTLAASGGTTPYSWSVNAGSVASRSNAGSGEWGNLWNADNGGDIQLHGQGNGFDCTDSTDNNAVVQHYSCGSGHTGANHDQFGCSRTSGRSLFDDDRGE